MPNQQSDNSEISNRQALGAAMFLCRTWATSFEVFLHKDIGSRYLGGQAAAVIVFIPLYCLFWQREDLAPMMWFLLAYLGQCGLHRVEALRRKTRGQYIHSQYNGRPAMMHGLRRCSERSVKIAIEPLFIAAGGVAASDLNRPLGVYMIGGAIAMAVWNGVGALWFETRAMDMHDAVLEQEAVAQRFREMRGEGN